jgi:hypothetical protein
VNIDYIYNRRESNIPQEREGEIHHTLHTERGLQGKRERG